MTGAPSVSRRAGKIPIRPPQPHDRGAPVDRSSRCDRPRCAPDGAAVHPDRPWPDDL